MSNELINHSPDLQRLVAEGYEISIRADHLLVGTVPYINAQGAIAFGVLADQAHRNHQCLHCCERAVLE